MKTFRADSYHAWARKLATAALDAERRDGSISAEIVAARDLAYGAEGDSSTAELGWVLLAEEALAALGAPPAVSICPIGG